jgi:hypothetical protein
VPLHIYQSLWGMQQLPWGSDRKWSLDQQLDLIADAGFDGVSLSFSNAAAAKHICDNATGRGLRIEALCFPTTVAELVPYLEAVEAVGREHVEHVTLQPNVRPHTLRECIPYILGWQELAQSAGITTYIETHRDRMTTDLYLTLELLDAVPSMQLTADLSHFVVGREFAMPVSDTDHALIRRVLQRSRSFHGRVASREQVQVQTSFPHHKLWLDLFAGWWLEGFRYLRAAIGPDEITTFTTELGPPYWYAITGPTGEELSDRWTEALQLADLARELWNVAETAPSSG